MDNEIVQIKQEIKFYIKESIKYFAKFTLTYMKQITMLILSIINSIVFIAVLLLSLLLTLKSTELSLIIMLYSTITHIGIKKKLDNYINKQFVSDVIQIEEKFYDAGYNLGEAYRKLKQLQNSKNSEEEIMINLDLSQEQESIEINTENKEIKYSYNYDDSTQVKESCFNNQYVKEDVKKKTKKK